MSAFVNLSIRRPAGQGIVSSLLFAALTASLATAAHSASVHETITAGAHAATSAAFIDSMGIGAHWEARDSTYKNVDALVEAIEKLGIHHVRGFDRQISSRLAQKGVTAMLVSGPEVGTPAAIAQMVGQANANGIVIDAVEGPNEADLFWKMHGYHYLGLGFPAGLIAYQRELFAAFRDIPNRTNLLVIGPSLGETYDPPRHPNPLPFGSLTNAVDLGNFHPYSFGGNSFSLPFAYGRIERYYWNGNFPSVNIDEYPYALNVYAPPFTPQPMAATETGYPTWRNGVSEEVQAIYLPRLFAEYFRLGIRRTYLYELADILADPAGEDMTDHFGIIRSDLSLKPAFTSLRSLVALLAGGAQKQPTGPAPVIDMTIDMPAGYDRVEFAHNLLLRVSDTKAFLLMWHEVADADTSIMPPRRIIVPDGRVTLTVAAPYKIDAWFGYDNQWELQRHAAADNGAVTAPFQDRITIFSLQRVGGVSP